jgi:hypothetical protein
VIDPPSPTVPLRAQDPGQRTDAAPAGPATEATEVRPVRPEPSPPAPRREPVTGRRARRRGPNPARPRRSARRRSTVLIAAAIVIPQLVLAGVLAYSFDLLPHRGAFAAQKLRDTQAQLGIGDCVLADPQRAQYYLEVACGDSRMVGTVIAVVAGPSAATESCDEDTDFFATRPGQVVCLRRTGDVHPGDPGQGGGVFRRGDCVISDGSPGVREVPCGSPAVFESVAARAAESAGCQPPAVRFATLDHGDLPVLCLADGPGLASTGECIADPDRGPVTFDAVPCGDEAAHARLLSRVATPQQCLAVPGQTHYVQDPNGLPASAVVCLQKIR